MGLKNGYILDGQPLSTLFKCTKLSSTTWFFKIWSLPAFWGSSLDIRYFCFMLLKSQIPFAALWNVPDCFTAACLQSCCCFSQAWLSHPLYRLTFCKARFICHFGEAFLTPSAFFPSCTLNSLPLFHSPCLMAVIYLAVFPTWLWAYLWYWSYSILESWYVGEIKKNAFWIDWMPMLQVSQ